ncbi:hypothetical protein ACTQ9L_07660 [Deinococcus wulumuqiensis]
MTDLAALKREARRKGTPPERLLELARMGPELAREVARSDNTLPDILARLVNIQPDDLPTLQKVAANKRTPAQTLTELAAHPQAEVVWWAAGNPATPLACLEALTEHPAPKVRSWLVSNPVMPLSVLVRWQHEFPHLIRIPLNSCTVGKAPPVHPYRRIRIFSYSHLLGLNLKLPDSIGIRMTYQALKTLVEYGEGAEFSAEELTRALILTDLIPAPAALRLLPFPEFHRTLLQNADKIAASVRPQILAQLQGGTP